VRYFDYSGQRNGHCPCRKVAGAGQDARSKAGGEAEEKMMGRRIDHAI